jgi:hypothetical protein
MYTGTIANINSRNVAIKSGPRAGSMGQIYILEMADGQSFETGFKKPPASIGDTVSFEHSFAFRAEQVDMKTFRMGTGAGGISSAVSVAGTSLPKAFTGGRDRQFPVPLLHGDRSIVRQNALAHATRLVSSTLNGVNATKSQLMDYAGEVIDIARKFEAYSCGDDEREASQKIIDARKE